MIEDVTTDTDKEMLIGRFVVLGDSDTWRLLVKSERPGDFGTIFHMRCAGYSGKRAHLSIESGTGMEMEETQLVTNPHVYFFKRDKDMWMEQVNVVAGITAAKPFMTMGQLKAFILSSHMHDYFFDADSSNPARSGGAQYWIICLLGELEEDGRIPHHMVISLKRFIQTRSDQLKAKAEKDPKYRIEWPTIQGHFPNAKLRWSESRAEAAFPKTKDASRK